MVEEIIDDELIEHNGNPKDRWAGFWIRVVASIVDLLVFLPFIAIVIYNQMSIKSLPLVLILTLIMMVYKPFMEFKYGATLGKMAVKIKVVNYHFTQINITQAIVRYFPWLLGNIVSIISTILLFQHPDFVSSTTFIEIRNLQNQLPTSTINFITSLVVLIAVIVVAFTSNKQGIHDMMAKTYCVYKDHI